MRTLAAIRTEIMALCRDGAYYRAYLRLLESALDARAAPSVWRYLYRKAQNAGSSSLVREIKRRMTDDGLYPAEIALSDAEEATRKGDHERARLLIEAASGETPADPDTRIALVRAIERNDPERAIALMRDIAFLSPDNALILIDLLRRTDRLNEAMRTLDEATRLLGQSRRMSVRRARILESLQDWEGAVAAWRDLLDQDPYSDPEPWLRVVWLSNRLQRHDDMERATLGALAAGLNVVQHVELAEYIEDSQLLEAAIEAYCDAPPSDAGPERDRDLLAMLLNTGKLGLARYVDARRGSRAGPMSDMLARGREHHGWAEVPPSARIAARQQSPSCLLPLPPATGLARPNYSFDPERDHLLLVNSSLNAGGAERQLVMLVASLIAHGMPKERIHTAFWSLVADRGQAHFISELAELGVAIHDLRAKTLHAPPSPDLGPDTMLLPAAMRRDVAALTPLVRQLRPKVIHAWQDRPALSGGWVAAQELVPRLVMSMRNMTPERRGGSPIKVDRDVMRALAQSPNTVLTANSSVGARDYESWLDLPEGTARILSNGIVVSDRLPRLSRSASGAIRLHGVFRFSPAKRPMLWLDTVARLQACYDVPIEPSLYGTGPLEEEMRRHAEEIAIRNLKIVTGEKDRRIIYGGADLVLLMSRIEGVPNVILEAQADGIAVAACDVGGTRDAMYDPGSGPDAGSLLFDQDIDAESAARRLAAWLPNALNAPRKPRQDHVRNNFSFESLGRTALDLYAQPPVEG